MNKEIKIVIRINDETGIVGIAEDFNALNMENGIDKTLYILGVYSHLLNHQLNKLNSIKKYEVKR